MDRANSVFSKVQRDDGTWRRPVLHEVPAGGKNSNRALGINAPLRMFNAFSSQHADALDELLAPFGNLSIGGDDFNTASWSIRRMTSSVLGAAAAFKNLSPLDESNPFTAHRRIQLQFDGMSWTRGHGCTRLIVRTPDVIRDYNSPLYSRDVLFYIGGDKLKDITANFMVGGDDSIHAALRSSMRFLPSADERTPEAFRFRCVSRMHLPAVVDADDTHEVCGACDVSVSAGGDMAAGHAGWALDSPIARYDCCLYCWLPKSDWFDAAKCKTATRRNLLLEMCLAHLDPFKLYEGAPGLPSRASPPSCPACNVVLTADFIAKEHAELESLSVQKFAERLREHRKTHYGKELHAELPVLFDHAERAPSLLHHRINTCSAAIAVTLANKATLSEKKKMNAVLLGYGQKWSFSERKGQRDTRPSGNESRALLSLKGLLRELLCTRYGREGEPDATEVLNEMSAAQNDSTHVDPAPAPPQVVGKKRKAARERPRTEVTSSGSTRRRPPPAPAPPPPPPPAASSAATPTPPLTTIAAAGEVQLDDDEDDFDSAEIDGADEAADFIPVAGQELSAGDMKSAAKVWLAVIELNEVLHKPFDDTSRSRRAEVGALCQAKGLAWVASMRAHCGNSVSFNYMHLSAAHLEELIAKHGMMERSDDEILERDNRTAKRIKHDLLFFGGSSDPSKRTQTRLDFRPVASADPDGEPSDDSSFEAVETTRRRVVGQGEQFSRLMLGRKLLLAERKQRSASDSVLHLAAQKREVKSEQRSVVCEHLQELRGA